MTLDIEFGMMNIETKRIRSFMSNFKKIAVTTDSNSGILPDELKHEGVFILPMPFLIDGKPYYENVNLSQENFYVLLNKQAAVSTSQPSPADMAEFWTEILKEYDEIVHIPMSSGLSQTCASATIVAQDFNGRVHVVDNRRISITLKESVFNALALRQQGKTALEIKNYLLETAGDSSIYIVVDTMKYLKKGGRVTPAAAMIGSILKIKPILQIQGAKLDRYALAKSISKAKETMKNAIKHDLTTRFATLVKNGEIGLSVAHTNNQAEAERFLEEIKDAFPNIPIRFCDALSLSVSCHIGPGSLAIATSRIVK